MLKKYFQNCLEIVQYNTVKNDRNGLKTINIGDRSYVKDYDPKIKRDGSFQRYHDPKTHINFHTVLIYLLVAVCQS